ncbi:MAG: polysaccharide deacetylase family protein [Salinivirgaceae bacterium]
MRFGLKVLSFVTGKQLIMPFYHAVSDQAPAHLKHLYVIRSQKQFSKDLEVLLQLYEPISIETLINYIRGIGNLPKYSFLLSFDDGLREFDEFAWPILKAGNLPVALFVNPDFTGNQKVFYRFKTSLLIEHLLSIKTEPDYKKLSCLISFPVKNKKSLFEFLHRIDYSKKELLDFFADFFSIDFDSYFKTYQPYLTLSEIQSLANQGVSIGGHSMDHPLFNQLSPDEQLRQLIQSVDWVKKHIGVQTGIFSFPFTDSGLPKSFFQQLKTNYPGLGATFGTAGIKNELIPFHFQRIPVEQTTWSMTQTLLFEYLYYLAKVPFFRNTIRR